MHNFKFRNLKPYKCVLYLCVCISHEIVMYLFILYSGLPLIARGSLGLLAGLP